MAFNGSLVTVGGFVVPLEYILMDTYKVTLNTLELEAYYDGNGVLHRETLDHIKGKIEFETPGITSMEVAMLFRDIEKNYIIPKERKANVTFYVPEQDNYMTQAMYLADTEYTISQLDLARKLVHYDRFRIAFIGY